MSAREQAELRRVVASSLLGVSMSDVMRSAEIAKGARVVRPGDEPWLSAEDWHEDVVVSVRGDRVRLVAIRAKNPGHGAFRRLIASVTESGLVPCVVCPFGAMRETLKRWGWRERHRMVDGEEFWEPRRGKRQCRK